MNQMKNTRVRRRKRKKSPFRKFLRFLFVVTLLFVLSAAGYGGYLAFKVNDAANESFKALGREKSDKRLDEVKMGEDPVNILMIGVESYKESPGHSDAMILLSINPKTKETAMVSIPRDTRTYLPIVDRKDKLSHSYAYGKKGEKELATIEAVEGLLDVPIDYYVKTNFNGFKEVVDELGGITVDVPFDFREKGIVDDKVKTFQFRQGEMDLNGPEALAYVQMRKKDPRGDFGRQERQQQAIKAIADKAMSISSIGKADNIIETLGDNAQTDITIKEMFGIRNFYKELANKDIKRLSLEGEDQTINGVYYYVPFDRSIIEVSNELKRILEIDQQDTNNESEY
ncbi:LCP family protein [Fictibacillus sp. 7GRE50]|uniref:LCP family glycopolymer transferase n=1 Tax=Fictibacillus sp. 7GRE50 TaxID=2745878 RepID=UPI0018CE35B9|nr:LCP family protein [Fictibacillus sp. 7GRE50]MBH0164065.1 LCP family protein [Fictibacillus sp. 7GRE50]